MALPLQAQERRVGGSGVRFLCAAEQWENVDQARGAADLLPLIIDDLRMTDNLLSHVDNRVKNDPMVQAAREARLRAVFMRSIEVIGVLLIAGGADSTTVMAGVEDIVEVSPVELLRDYSYRELQLAARICLVPEGT